MEMKLNSALIVKLRNSHAWSQQHLAEICDVSLRTIQRVENNGNASQETAKALAAAFSEDVAKLLVNKQEELNSFNSISVAEHLVIMCSVAVSLMSFAIFLVPVTSANGLKISAVKTQYATDGRGTEYMGNVLISVPANTELQVFSKKSWNAEGVALFSGEVSVSFDDTTIHLNDASIHNNEGTSQINSTYARVVKSQQVDI